MKKCMKLIYPLYIIQNDSRAESPQKFATHPQTLHLFCPKAAIQISGVTTSGQSLLTATLICSGYTRVLSALPLTDKPGLASELQASWALASFDPKVPWAGLVQEALLRTRHRASQAIQLSGWSLLILLWLEGNGLTRSPCQRTVRDDTAPHDRPCLEGKKGEKAQLPSKPVKGYEHVSLYATYVCSIQSLHRAPFLVLREGKASLADVCSPMPNKDEMLPHLLTR